MVLGVIAVVGHDTDHGLLVGVAGLPEDRLEAGLRAAIAARLLVVDADTDAYRFRHALIGEVVYAELLPPERRRLHRRIADALRAQGPQLLSRADRASELAVHLDRAGDQPAAFTALLAAADASETVAPGAALRHLERAFELWDAAGDAAATERRGDRLWQAAELASGTASNERAADARSRGVRLRAAAAGHGVGPRTPRSLPVGVGTLGTESRSSSRRRPHCLPRRRDRRPPRCTRGSVRPS